MYKEKVLSGYRITLPKKIRERLGVKIGDEVTIDVEDGKIVIKVRDFSEDPVIAMAGIAGKEIVELKDYEESVVEELKEKDRRSKQ